MSEAQPSKRITLTLADVDQAYQRVRRVEAVVRQYDVTVSMLLMLRSVADHPASPVSRHAGVLRLTPSVVSNGLDRIEKRGLVRRIPKNSEDGAADHRQVFVEVTDRGRELLAELATIEVEL